MLIPIPTNNEPDPVEVPASTDETRNRWILWFLDCEHWKCACGITNFGRNKYCANTKCKQPRPTSYVENVFPT
jgi:hypothetical protein